MADRSVESWATVLLLWAAGICAAMQFSKISIGFLSFQHALGIDAPAVGAIMGAAGFVGLIFGVCSADFAARIGFRQVLIWSLAAASILSFAEMTMPRFAVFYGLRLIEGASNLFIVVAAPTLIAQIVPRSGVALAMGLWGTFYDVAFTITGVGEPVVIALGGAGGLLLAHGSICLIVAAGLCSRPIALNQNKYGSPREDLGEMLRSLALRNVQAYRCVATAAPGMMFFFVSALYLGFVLFVPLFAEDSAVRTFLSVTLPIMSIFGALLAGPLGQTRFGPARALAFGFPVLGLLGSGLLAAYRYSDDIRIYIAVASATVFVSGLLQGSAFVLVTKLARSAQEEAVAFGVIAQLGSLGSIVGPVAFAIVIQRHGFIGFTALVGAAAVAVLPVAIAGVRAFATSHSEFVGADATI